MADTTDCIYEKKEPKVFPNHTGHALKVFAIHMFGLIIVAIVAGILAKDNAIMWLFGGAGAFFMVGWHLNNIDNAMRKDKNWYNE